MDRRQFVRNAVAVSAMGGLTSLSPTATKSLRESEKPADFSMSPNDDSDRSPNRDPLAIQGSTLIVDGLDSSEFTEKYVRMLKESGIGAWHFTLHGLDSYTDTYNFLDQHTKDIVPVTTVREIQQAQKDGKIGLIFGWQTADYLETGLPQFYGPPRTNLRAYYQMGLRILGMTYNVANIFGAGNLEPQIGLTRAGHRLVEEIHKLGIILDVGGHTGEQTSLDAIAVSGGHPVVCTHSNVAAIADNPRCTSDRVIEAIAKTGGVVGLTAVNDFHVRRKKDVDVPHSPRVTLEAHLDQFDYLRKLVGAEHIGIGPDFIYGQKVDWDLTYKSAAINRETLSDGPALYVKGFENITELPNVTRGLIQRGWSTGEIRKVLGENWLRVYKSVWGK